MDGQRVVQRLVNGETALEIAKSFGYRSPTPVMDAARDFIVAKLGAECYSALADQPGMRLVAWIGGVGALSPTRVPGHAMRTYSGRPKSNIRFRTLVAM